MAQNLLSGISGSVALQLSCFQRVIYLFVSKCFAGHRISKLCHRSQGKEPVSGTKYLGKFKHFTSLWNGALSLLFLTVTYVIFKPRLIALNSSELESQNFQSSHMQLHWNQIRSPFIYRTSLDT